MKKQYTLRELAEGIRARNTVQSKVAKAGLKTNRMIDKAKYAKYLEYRTKEEPGAQWDQIKESFSEHGKLELRSGSNLLSF